jgi:hypothetical protein
MPGGGYISLAHNPGQCLSTTRSSVAMGRCPRYRVEKVLVPFTRQADVYARVKIIIPESVHSVRPGERSGLRLVPAEGDALSRPPVGWRSRAATPVTRANYAHIGSIHQPQGLPSSQQTNPSRVVQMTRRITYITCMRVRLKPGHFRQARA